MEEPAQSADTLSPESVTRLLSEVGAGDAAAVEQLLPLVYTELRNLARAIFSRQNSAHTLQPTAVVHEAWMKLAGHIGTIEDKRHFLVVAGKAMRQVIADHARGKLREKRGGTSKRVALEDSLSSDARKGLDVIALDESLRRLEMRDERHAKVAELRILSGLSIEETAEAMGVSPRTIDSWWAIAKAWLRRDLANLR